jgi:tetratricopeptide (TPR) repeat protein
MVKTIVRACAVVAVAMMAPAHASASAHAISNELRRDLAVAGYAGEGGQELGTITFPTSGAAAAQAPFLEGVKNLHSFQFDEAAEACRRAQKTDPSFAMAYWCEAMSHNHPLWAQQDTAAAKAILEKIAPTLDGRLAKVKTDKEKAFLRAIDVLYYSPGEKLARDTAYSSALAQMYAQWPNDHEVATWYALSLLGTVRPTDRGFRRQALAASIAQKVFAENPKHPGAAHFVIHAFDDPDHAPLGLPAAREYAGIAPSAAHALHMPSHIFVQLGMWNDVRTSNIAAYKAAVDLNTRMKLAEGREDFHTLSWLQYANLMLGNVDEAKRNVESAKQAADRNPTNTGIRNGYLAMRARLILETEAWERIALDAPAAPAAPGAPAHAGMPGMAMPSSNVWVFIAGYSAAKLGDLKTAEAAETQLRASRVKLEGDQGAFNGKYVAVMEKQVGALIRYARGQKDEALKLAKEAVDIELTLAAPSGPADPIKPAPEFYGEMLLDSGRNPEAIAALELALQRTPNRTPSVKALQRARATGTAMR